MGMFDDITCQYPLPLEGANDLDYQTKDTPSQRMDRYEIRQDGTLWHEDYDEEDQSVAGLWRKDHPGEPEPKWTPAELFGGMCCRVNKRWVAQGSFIGEIIFVANYRMADDKMANATLLTDWWLSWSSYFVSGKLLFVTVLQNRAPR